ncbi:polyprenyl synthetase family protein [Dermabacter sp. p3-SID358]|uniref:polyprenyl synthetase family protein n=1 Tax=Dermabacter sp. p3-SID358 TaxID=2916114 RepID=UPI0021A6C910|nr:polyprenyl synthetase family protein [Dermabacter sp. p3-SID358]MCT1867743.1 polyprenyl synthetase family protein [Dermabacter sp. p3-SID358]
MASFTMDDIDPSLAESIQAGLEAIEEKLHAAVATSDPMMRSTAPYLLDAGGKRVRPVLVMLAGAFGDITSSQLIDAGALVELTHLATLYHDDVMDGADTRRGTKAAHRVWGNNIAILTGDFLLARASAMSAGLGSEIVAVHAHTFERLCLGQLNETVGPGSGDDPFVHYIDVLSNKTGSLIAAAGVLGAMIAGAPESVVATMREYGEAVGVAFQLADDVLDIRASSVESGKTPGTDLREGVPTMPSLLLRAHVEKHPEDTASAALLAAVDGDLSSDDRLAEVVSALSEHPVVDETERLAETYADRALALVESLPAGPPRDALTAFTVSLVRRRA